MSYPGLAHDDHKFLGSEYCSGFSDIYGKWNTGFYCPPTSPTVPVYCCGTSYYKYCCIDKYNLLSRQNAEDDNNQPSDVSPYTFRVPVAAAIFCGVLAVTIFLVMFTYFFCSCCGVYYKKRRRDNIPFSGLYHIQGSSSTNSALTSIYSPSNPNTNSVVTTPLDTDWSSVLSPSASCGYIPNPLLLRNSPSAPSPSSGYFSSLGISSMRSNSISSNNGPNPIIPHNNNNHPLSALYFHNGNHNNGHGQAFSSVSSLSSIYQQLSARRSASPLSTLSNSTISTGNGGRSHPQQYQSLQNSSQYNLPMPISEQSLNHPHHPEPPPPYSSMPLPEENGLTVTDPLRILQLQSCRLMNSALNNGSGCPSGPSVVGNGNNGNGIGATGESRRFPLRQTEDQRQQRSTSYVNVNVNANRAIGGNNPGNNGNQHERLSLALLQSLINAYQRAGPGNSNSREGVLAGGNPASLTQADVNRLSAINLLVSTILNQQNQNQIQARAQAQRQRGNGESESVIRASSSSLSSSSVSGGENSENVNTTSANTTESESDGSSETITPDVDPDTLGVENGSSADDSDGKEDFGEKVEKVAESKTLCNLDNDGDARSDFVEEDKGKEIQIIETSVPFEGDEQSFDVLPESGEIKEEDYISSEERTNNPSISSKNDEDDLEEGLSGKEDFHEIFDKETSVISEELLQNGDRSGVDDKERCIITIEEGEETSASASSEKEVGVGVGATNSVIGLKNGTLNNLDSPDVQIQM